ncbi:hypothetical protein TNCV_215291 [Trichonephila clavipes]|nr:hypothetical protein TNCV_215291 [Trichonephila clavipes]
MKVDGKILTFGLNIAKTFLNFYRKVSNFRLRRQIRKREINSPRVNQEWDRLLSAPFSDEEFQRALQKFRGKSAGPDGILPQFILEFSSKRLNKLFYFL